MGLMQTAAQIWRDYVTDGVPSSGKQKPKKSDIRAWGAWVESIVNAFISTGGLIYTSRASLFADLARGANSTAWVIGDATVAYNGVYMKVGASGTGSWTRVADLPYSFVKLTDAGAGTANAIQLTSAIPASAFALRVANVFRANTGNVTISENGSAAKPLLTSSGNQIAPGGLLANMMISYVDDGANFRLLSDQASAALVAAAEAAANRAEVARDAALGAVPNAFPPTRTALKALDTTTVTSAYLKEAGREGQFVWKSGDYAARIASDPLEGLYIKANAIAASAGAWVRAAGWEIQGKNVRWFGADGAATAAINTAAIQAAINLRGLVVIPDGGGDYQVNDSILVRSNTTVRFTGSSFLKLVANTSIGGILLGYYESPGNNSSNILIENPLIDGNNVGAESGNAAGEVGCAGSFVVNMRIIGGVVKNCRNGTSVWSGSGGRAVQFDGNCRDCVVDGTLVVDCHAAMAAGGTNTSPTSDVSFRNITAVRCDNLIQARHTNSPPTLGVDVNSFLFENITAYNCGKTTGYWATQGVQVGAVQIDRANYCNMRNIVIWNDAAYGSISAVVRHLRGNYNNVGVVFAGDCTTIVDSNSIPTGFGSTGTRNANVYEIHHRVGTANRALYCLAGDAQHSANVYRIKTATVTTELFDASAAQPGLTGFFENAVGDKSVEGLLIVIDALYSRNYPATFSRARAGSLQFNNIYMTYSTGAQILGTATTDQLIFQINLVEKLRITGGGFRAVLPTYADNAAAATAGLVAGDVYKTSTGELRIRV